MHITQIMKQRKALSLTTIFIYPSVTSIEALKQLTDVNVHK